MSSDCFIKEIKRKLAIVMGISIESLEKMYGKDKEKTEERHKKLTVNESLCKKA